MSSQPKASESIAELLALFQELLPAPVLEAELQASGRRFYQRLFTPLVLIWCLVFQRLNADHKCDAVVSYVGGGALDHLDPRQDPPLSQRLRSEDCSAFCQGRQRLPLAVLQAALQHTASTLARWANLGGRWLGHPVALLDGTTFCLRPEPALVAHYGRHQNQHGPLYWVTCRSVAAFCLHSGALLALAEGPLKTSEQALAKEVLAQGQAGTVYVGDGNFGVYQVAQAAWAYGQHVLFRLASSRARKLAGQTLTRGADVAATWRASRQDQVHLDLPPVAISGRVFAICLERDGFRPQRLYFFTTLADCQRYPSARLLELYGLRWQVELDLGYIKDTLDMGLLVGRSVDVIRKQLWAGALAYNLIRAAMLQAACRSGKTVQQLSFTRCWRRVADCILRPASHQPAAWAQALVALLKRVARCRLPRRPLGRSEPRAVRRRPMTYPNLKGDRNVVRQKAAAKRMLGSKS